VIVDTSAWVEFLRGTGSHADHLVGQGLRDGRPIAVAGVIVEEVLQGCRTETQVRDVHRLLTGCRSVEPVYPETYVHAALLYRRCRRAGRTVRGTIDCLIGALALEHGLPLLTLDRDFDALGAVAGVRVVRA